MPRPAPVAMPKRTVAPGARPPRVSSAQRDQRDGRAGDQARGDRAGQRVRGGGDLHLGVRPAGDGGPGRPQHRGHPDQAATARTMPADARAGPCWAAAAVLTSLSAALMGHRVRVGSTGHLRRARERARPPCARMDPAHTMSRSVPPSRVEEYVMDAQLSVPVPRNEPVRGYAPGSAERELAAGAAGRAGGRAARADR